MLNMTGEEWAFLNSVPEFKKMMSQIQREIDRATTDLADAAILSMEPNEIALKYAVAVSGIAALKEITYYQPIDRERDEAEFDE